MTVDFGPIDRKEMQIFELAQRYSPADLRAATNQSLDTISEIMRGMNDAQMTFLPHDPQANDPYAKPGEEQIGWSLAHLVAHVTASSEEWATYSSILARGIVYPPEPRLRYETDWQSITTAAQVFQRLEESRRLRLSYLSAWPDQPHYDIQRELSPRYLERFGPMNAPAAFLFGLWHEVGHHEQFREVARQAREAFAAAAH